MGKCKFNAVWLSRLDSKGLKYGLWLRREDEDKAYCTVCNCSINVSKGFKAVTQHELKDKHASNLNIKLSPSQLRLTSASSSATNSNGAQGTNRVSK